MSTTHYRITSDAGIALGIYPGATPEEALDAMARDAGYASQDDTVSGGVAPFAGSVEAYEPTTEESLTDEQIETLLAEAERARDYLAAAICAVALASHLDEIADVGEHRADLEALGIIPEHVDADVHARREVARMIREAEVQMGAPGVAS